MPRHQFVCDACKVKFPCSMGATGVTMFVPKHVEHNFHAGVRIELVEFPSPRRSNLYALVDPGNPNRYGPENPLP